MKFLRTFRQLQAHLDGCVATIGNFDGVHRGHQALLALLKSKSYDLQLPSLVMLFEPQPAEYFSRSDAPVRLCRLREKLQALSQYEIDYVFCLTFDNSLANMFPEEFAENIIFSQLNAKHLLLGQDFRFGRARLGDLTLLKQIASKHGCIVEAYPDFCVGSERVSSTQVRLALSQGDMLRAAELLGRPYSMCGRVVYGQGLARQWGVPTANLVVWREKLPISGVFFVEVRRQDNSIFNGVANIGFRPTVDGRKAVLEIHLFDFDESLYGEMLHVFFLHKLRDEIKFSSVDALFNQIHTDIDSARKHSLTIF